MSEHSDQQQFANATWHAFLTGSPHTPLHSQRKYFRWIPGDRRCKLCKAPLQGVGAPLIRVFYKKKPSKLNPMLCNVCDEFSSEHQGGAEVELSLLFVDVRGSTTLAEQMSPTEFSQLINRFYNAATHVMIHTDALIDKVIGDQAAGMYVPGFAGPDHARKAIRAAQRILHAVGYGTSVGPWIPLGAGVLTGTAYVGSVGSAQRTTDITVLGDAANTAARLSGKGNSGEILISDDAFRAAGLDLGKLEIRDLELKGKTETTRVHVLTDYGR